METFNKISVIVNVVLMFFSMWSSWRSCKYYNKSRYLTTHTNLSKALLEIEKMQKKIPDCLSALAQSRKARGFNFPKSIGAIGQDLSNSLIAIHSCVPSELTGKLMTLEKSTGFDLNKFINECISGRPMILESNFEKECSLCQERLNEMQNYLKEQVDKAGDKLK